MEGEGGEGGEDSRTGGLFWILSFFSKPWAIEGPRGCSRRFRLVREQISIQRLYWNEVSSPSART